MAKSGKHEAIPQSRSGGDGSGGRARIRGWRAAADGAIGALLKSSGADRSRRVGRLLGSAHAEAGSSPAALGEAVRDRLVRSLEAERRRARARHWTYDFNRHVALLQALAVVDARAEDAEAGGERKTPPGEPDGV